MIEQHDVITLLYLLMRDHLSTGIIEGIVAQIERTYNGGADLVRSCPHLEAKAKDLVRRLVNDGSESR